MNYAPAVSPESGNYIMQGLRMSQQNGEMMAKLLGYFMERSNRKAGAGAEVEALAGGDGSAGGSGAAGFNPMAPGQAGAPSDPTAGDEGPSPAAQRGTQAEALRKLIQSYAPEAKDLHTAVKAMSVDQLEGMLKGYALKQAAGEHAAKMQNYLAEADQHTQNALDDKAAGGALNRFFSAPNVDDGKNGTRPATFEERMKYAMSGPDLAGRPQGLAKLLNSLATYQQATSGGTSKAPQEFKLGDRTGIFSPATGKFQVDKTAMTDLKPVPVPDKDGNILAYMMPTGDGKYTRLDPSGMKPAELARLQTSQTRAHLSDHRSWSNQLLAAKGALAVITDKKSDAYKQAQQNVQDIMSDEPKLDDYLAPLKGLGGNPKGAAKGETAGPPKVTSRADYDKLPKGTKFVGADGKAYVKP